ncbi:hypothetical protein RF11_03719 [Thelohanellus kitauei]|uniref:Uncharacterized protein n=1 Tax=Thelohanellus kitauei TaxID=669202 RepID=A0A0C2IWC7_THEKT|nr:hypothetical protein RF11_03719 [Thelohanellus kitauei]
MLLPLLRSSKLRKIPLYLIKNVNAEFLSTNIMAQRKNMGTEKEILHIDQKDSKDCLVRLIKSPVEIIIKGLHTCSNIQTLNQMPKGYNYKYIQEKSSCVGTYPN